MADTLQGLVYNLPEAQYHSRPEMSQSGAKAILDSPARFHYQRTAPQKPRDPFDLGSAIHTMALGAGAPALRLDYPNRRSNDYKAAAEEAREAGFIPLIAKTYDTARAAAARVLAHDVAGPLLTRPGWSEVSMFWTDPDTDVKCRGRIDRLTHLPDRHLLIDFKTTSSSASPGAFARTITDFRYDVQEAAYRSGYSQIVGAPVEMMFIVVETEPPHEVGVYTIDAEDIEAAAGHWRHALNLYKTHTATGQWPGYTDTEPQTLVLPAWHRRR